MGLITEEDLALIPVLRELGVLQDVNPKLLDLSKGVIEVVCSDCDQREDADGHLEDLFHSQGLPPRIHQFKLNGGALLIPEESPLNDEFGEDRALIYNHIPGACLLKGMKVIVLYAHVPCGAAGLIEPPLTGVEVIDFLMLGEARIHHEFPEMTVACFFHVDKGHGQKRTYFVDHASWLKWFEKRGTHYPAIGRVTPLGHIIKEQPAQP